MGNIQSFNNFTSTITNTFSLPFINKMLKKNNLTDPTYYRKLGNEFKIDETTGTIVQL